MYNLVNLKGKRILVTGASSGIGRATAILLSKMEAIVIIVARNEQRLKETLSQMEGKGHRYYCFDLNEGELIEPFVRQMLEETGALDGFVHCAGIAHTRPLKMTKINNIQEHLMVNTISFIEFVKCLAKKKAHNAGFSVVGISSIAALQGSKSKVAYCTSKAGFDGAIRAMEKELGPQSIRINAVNPGYIKTEMFATLLDGVSADSQDFESQIERQYLGIGEPEDVANVAAFLLSDAAKFITGTSILVDGGRCSS